MNPCPTWTTDVEALFASPYWIDPAQQDATGARWRGCMEGYGVDLGSYKSVRQWAMLIYHYLHSRAMPLTDDPREYWPNEALETLRLWVNQGYRYAPEEPVRDHEILPKPESQPITLGVRRDILSLTTEELNEYRARLDDFLDVGNPAPDAAGQIFSYVHGDWCLHYQEAFLFWHRAYLMRFEQVIGCPVPYWNWFAADASVDGSPAAGLPAAFQELTYVHPRTGETRPNPLRFAAAKDGQSKACVTANWPPCDCRYVQRDPVLYTSGEDHRVERLKKLGLLRLFQDQVVRALQFDVFSTPQGWPDYPWANIQSFDPPPPDSDYPYRDENFDGAYEQPHDNFHGWVGPDMADNAYTSFDPVFWSYHANIDRVFEMWLRKHPAALYTAGFPIHPFWGSGARRFEYDDPRSFVYTTIGDLAKDSRALGYDYAPPAYPDVVPLVSSQPNTSLEATTGPTLLVVFEGVRCTLDSYTIDVFLNQEGATLTDADVDNPHYVGRLTRIGMGVADDKGRCIRVGVRRSLDASQAARKLGLAPSSQCQVSQVVTDIKTGKCLAPSEYGALPGFVGKLVWKGISAQSQAADAATSHQTGGSCCGKHRETPHHNHPSRGKSQMNASEFVFNTPAGQGPKDYETAGAPGLQAFLQDWNDNISQWTAMSVIGNPWSNQNDAPRAYYFNPAATGWADSAPTTPPGVNWTPFPNRLTTFFTNSGIVNGGQLAAPLTQAQLFELADLGSIAIGSELWMLYNPDSSASNVLKIPATKCPGISWTGDYASFSPAGPRGWLDEYCEWSVLWKDNQPGGTIESVMFTCENPAYWLTLWNQDPKVVLALYQTYIDPAVALEDLYLTYPAGSPQAGQPVVDPTTGNPAYNPTNKWNAGTLRLPGQSGGAMHLTSPPNTLSAEIYLAAASTIQRINISPGNPQSLICCSQYGQSFRNSDPNIGAAGNLLSASQFISLADPVGLYIQTPNWSLFQTPDGTPASEFWTVTRGFADPNGNPGELSDSILHAVFEVPASKGYTVSDIKILNMQTGNWENIAWAGQIATTFKIALRVVGKPSGSAPPNTQVGCVASQPDASLQPWPAQFVPSTLFYGNSPTDLPSRLACGQTYSMALVVQGASSDTTSQNARVEFDNPGVTGTVTEYFPNAGAIPGLTNAGGTQAYIVQVTVAANAVPGPLGIRAINPYETSPTPAEHPFEQGLAMVVAA